MRDLENSIQHHIDTFSDAIQDDYHGRCQTLKVFKTNGTFCWEVWDWNKCPIDSPMDFIDKLDALGATKKEVYRTISALAVCIQRETDYKRINRH